MTARLLSIAAMARYTGMSRQTIYTYLEKYEKVLRPFVVRTGKRTKLRESAAGTLYALRAAGIKNRGKR